MRILRAEAIRPVVGLALLLPVCLLLFIFFIYPVAQILLQSFTEPTLGLQNYIALWRTPANLAIVENTFAIALWTTLICMVLAYPYAYHISRLKPGAAGIFIFLSFVPLFTAILARLYAWTVILGRRGIVNNLLIALGLIDRPLSLLFTPLSVTIGMVHVLLPYMIIVLYSVMLSIDRGLLEASRTLGANRFQTFWRVFLPLSMRGVYAGALLVFIVALGFFITPAVLGGADQLTMAVYIEQQVNILRWGTASAMAMVLLTITVALFIVFDQVFGAQRLITGGSRR
jgi:ABC-type spermidine/putrescine transport system permease subunit I